MKRLALAFLGLLLACVLASQSPSDGHVGTLDPIMR